MASGAGDEKFRNQYVSSLNRSHQSSTEGALRQTKSTTGLKSGGGKIYEYEPPAGSKQSEGTEIHRILGGEDDGSFEEGARYGDSINLHLDVSQNNAMNGESHFLNASQSILEVEDEEADGGKSGSTQSKSSKSIGMPQKYNSSMQLQT